MLLKLFLLVIGYALVVRTVHSVRATTIQNDADDYPDSFHQSSRHNDRHPSYITGSGFRQPSSNNHRTQLVDSSWARYRSTGNGFRQPTHYRQQQQQQIMNRPRFFTAADTEGRGPYSPPFLVPAVAPAATGGTDGQCMCACPAAPLTPASTPAALVQDVPTQQPYRIVCYFPQWARYRPGIDQLLPGNVDPNLCTHINYAFANLKSDGSIVSFDPWADIDLKGFQAITGLKQQNPNLKVLIALGGWSAGSQVFSQVAASPALRSAFNTYLLTFLQTYNFDGLDIDWEFPAFNGGQPQDRQNFAVWLAEIRAAFAQQQQVNGEYLLTIAATASSDAIDTAYDLPAIVPSVDWINLMSYDYHIASEPQVNHHSPLNNMPNDPTPTYNTDWSVNHYLQSGVPANKIVVGVPLYGRGWTLANANNYKILSAGAGPSQAGQFTQTPGILSYLEICLDIKNNGWQQYSEYDRTYAVGQGQWVGYDAPEDAARKAEYVIEHNLGGIMFWDLSFEDFGNNCGGGPNPIVNAVKGVLEGGAEESNATTTATPATTEPSTSPNTEPTDVTEITTESSTLPTTAGTTPSSSSTFPPNVGPSNGLKCLTTGFFADPRYSDCSRFVRCVQVHVSGPPMLYEFSCGPGTVFDSVNLVCGWPYSVQCTFNTSALQIV